MKGANRKLFRKPGLARQAIGILASSKELADQVQQVAPNMMPQQPVQNFRNGGLASMLGITPAGYEMQGEELVARPGFSGMYERMSGISDPARAREQSALDLIKLGARIAGGESTSATTNIAKAVTESVDDLAKNRQTEFAMTLKEAEMARALENAKLDREYKDASLRLSGMTSSLKEAIQRTGGSFTTQGTIMGPDGEVYPNAEAFKQSLPPKQQDLFDQSFISATDAATRRLKRLGDETVPFTERYAEAVTESTSNDPDQFDAKLTAQLVGMTGQGTPSRASTIGRIVAGATGQELPKDEASALALIPQEHREDLQKYGAYFYQDKVTNKMYFMSGRNGQILFEVDIRDTDETPAPAPDETPVPKDEEPTEPDETSKVEEPESVYPQMITSLNLTPQEREIVSQDRGLQNAERDLQKAEERLDAALAGTKNLDAGAVEKQVETHRRRVEREYVRLMKQIENRRKRAEKGPRTRS